MPRAHGDATCDRDVVHCPSRMRSARRVDADHHPGPRPRRTRRRARHTGERAGRQRLRDRPVSRSRVSTPGASAARCGAGTRTGDCVRSATPAPISSRSAPPPTRCAPSPTGPAGPAAAAPPSSAPPNPPRLLWRLLEPQLGPGPRDPRPPAADGHRAAAGTRSRPTLSSAGSASDEMERDHAGLRRDVHRGGRRLAAGRRRRAALPGPGRRTGRRRPVVRPDRGRQGRLQGRDRRGHPACLPDPGRLGRPRLPRPGPVRDAAWRPSSGTRSPMSRPSSAST